MIRYLYLILLAVCLHLLLKVTYICIYTLNVAYKGNVTWLKHLTGNKAVLNSKSVCSGYIFAVDPDKTRKITINALKHFQGCAIIFSVTMELLY